VVFIEHKLLYDTIGEVPEEEYTIEMGAAAVRREGADCTLVSYSRMALKCLEAAEELERRGIACEVIDLRTLVPMDRKTILASVEKTGRLVIVTEAVKRGSVASDIAAWAAENAFTSLKAPVARVTGLVTPIPYNQGLEQACVPDVDAVVRAVTGIVNT